MCVQIELLIEKGGVAHFLSRCMCFLPPSADLPTEPRKSDKGGMTEWQPTHLEARHFVSKYNFPNINNQGSWKNGWFQTRGRGSTRWAWNILHCQKVNKCSKTGGRMSQQQRSRHSCEWSDRYLMDTVCTILLSIPVSVPIFQYWVWISFCVYHSLSYSSKLFSIDSSAGNMKQMSEQ